MRLVEKSSSRVIFDNLNTLVLNERQSSMYNFKKGRDTLNKIIDDLLDIRTKEELKAYYHNRDNFGTREIYEFDKVLNDDSKSVKECIRTFIKILEAELDTINNQEHEFNDYNSRADELENKIGNFLKSKFNNVITLDENIAKEYGLWNSESHGFLINDTSISVDDLLDMLEEEFNIKTHGTGRGGSWTAWDYLSTDGIAIKAGYTKVNGVYFVAIQ